MNDFPQKKRIKPMGSTVILEVPIKMNTSLDQNPMQSCCSSPTLFNHAFMSNTTLLPDPSKVNPEENTILTAINATKLKTLDSYHHLDPYIDAVQVKSRINNKRGPRVKAAPSHVDRRVAEDTTLKSPSYYTKTVLVKSKGGAHGDHEYGDTSDEDSDGDEDDEHVEHHHYYHQDDHDHHALKKPHSAYLDEHKGSHGHGYEKDLDDHHNHYPQQGGKGKHHSTKYHKRGKKKRRRKKGGKMRAKKKHGRGKKAKKVTYAYILEPVHGNYHSKGQKEHYNYNSKHNGYTHDKHYDKGGNKYGKGHAGGYHDDHLRSYHAKHAADKGFVYQKGRLSLAGLLGYALLCVNYLMVQQQPSYDMHGGYHYNPYAPHHDPSKGGQVVTAGPVILAHCGKLPAPTGVTVHMGAAASTKVSAQSRPKRGANQHSTDRSQSIAAAASPPSYYYTLAPGFVAKALVAAATESTKASVLSPIQSYLNRLLLPEISVDGPADEYTPIQVVRAPAARIRIPAGHEIGRTRTIATGERALLITGGNSAGRSRSSTAVATSRRRVNGALVVASRGPQVVRTQDNLAGLRDHNVEIGMRVVRNRLVGPQRPLSVAREDDTAFDWAPVAVRAPASLLVGRREPRLLFIHANDQMQADQPDRGENNASVATQPAAPGNNQILDLPEYALSGDSIELTCNHRIPVARLYSVKWFKDSLEFYRFIPANGPRTKSTLFLPDVRLDLARSNADTVYLRNVSHRSSGLYRCEAVSEGPSFETMSGEKAMQVYALPERSPQLAVLEPQNPTRPASDLIPLVQTALPILTTSLGWPEPTSPRAPQPSSPDAGPLVRCISSASNPVAQLRFFIDNRPVELSRTLENRTDAYSDELETQVVSFRLRLSDFTNLGPNSRGSGMERAGDDKAVSNLKQKSGQREKPEPAVAVMSQRSGAQRSSTARPSSTTSTTTSTSTTTTTSTTTARPRRQQQQANRGRANANVQFDEPQQQRQQPANRARADPKGVSSTTRAPDRKRDNSASGRPRQQQQRASNSTTNNRSRQSLAAAASGEEARNGAGSDQDEDEDPDAQQRDNNAGQERKSPDTVAASMANYGSSSDPSVTSSAPIGGARVKRQSAVTGGGGANGNANGGDADEQLYSDYIRIKCASLVPAVGYELVSELNVPLTLVVPARALREPTASNIAQRARGQDDTLRRRPDTSGQGNPGRPIRRGGSSGVGGLQAPRLVQIDRMAQASAAPTRVTALHPNSGTNQTSSSQAKAAPRPTTARDRALEQRAKYLDELSGVSGGLKQAKSAANASYLKSGLLSAQLIATLVASLWLGWAGKRIN